MVADSLAFGVRRSAFAGTVDAKPTAMAEDRTPNPKRQTPSTVRCPQCGHERARAELVRKGQRLGRCNACYRAERRAGRQRWEEHNRARRTRLRHGGGVPCPPYVAWSAWSLGPGHEAVAVAVDPQEPDAVVLPAYGACSCGEAGCVHLVVACLAQQEQQEGGSHG